MSNSLQTYGLYPARLLGPWDFPGKDTGVDCHFLLQKIFLIFLNQRIELASLALAGGFLTTEPPGKSKLGVGFLKIIVWHKDLDARSFFGTWSQEDKWGSKEVRRGSETNKGCVHTKGVFVVWSSLPTGEPPSKGPHLPTRQGHAEDPVLPSHGLSEKMTAVKGNYHNSMANSCPPNLKILQALN